jgi:hypothetical protein
MDKRLGGSENANSEFPGSSRCLRLVARPTGRLEDFTVVHRAAPAALAICFVCGFAPAIAQQFPFAPGLTSGLGGLPNVSAISPGNAAGVLGYCMKNNVLKGGDATSVVNGLMKKPEITSSNDYSAGHAGQILTGQGKSFSLNGMPDQMQSKACNMVLKQAGHFL